MKRNFIGSMALTGTLILGVNATTILAASPVVEQAISVVDQLKQQIAASERTFSEEGKKVAVNPFSTARKAVFAQKIAEAKVVANTKPAEAEAKLKRLQTDTTYFVEDMNASNVGTALVKQVTDDIAKGLYSPQAVSVLQPSVNNVQALLQRTNVWFVDVKKEMDQLNGLLRDQQKVIPPTATAVDKLKEQIAASERTFSEEGKKVVVNPFSTARKAVFAQKIAEAKVVANTKPAEAEAKLKRLQTDTTYFVEDMNASNVGTALVKQVTDDIAKGLYSPQAVSVLQPSVNSVQALLQRTNVWFVDVKKEMDQLQRVLREQQKVTPPTTNSLHAFEQRVIELTNVERQKAGLSALQIDLLLSKVAREKSQDMATHHYFDHNSPTYGSPFDMMKHFGIVYRSAGENIAKGQRTPEEVVQAWMNSAGHRANILNASYTHIGLGYVENGDIWTQQFIWK